MSLKATVQYPSKIAPTLSVLYMVTITALYTVTLVLSSSLSPCMHACQSAVTGQVTGGPSAVTRSSQPPTGVSCFYTGYRVDVLNKERIMSYKEQGVGVGILEYFPVLDWNIEL